MDLKDVSPEQAIFSMLPQLRHGTSLIVFQAHEQSAETMAAYHALSRSVKDKYAIAMLLDRKGSGLRNLQLRENSSVVEFDSRDFKNWDLPVFGTEMLPGHCHYPLLLLSKQLPGVPYIWFVEYDVRFGGDWATLFDSFASDDSDLLCCHLKSRAQEPAWRWWSSLKCPHGVKLDQVKVMRTFLVIARYSRRALGTLVECHKQGWTGHQEVVIPTCLTYAGLRVADFNFVQSQMDSARKPIYTSWSNLGGTLEEFGSIRYRPPHIDPDLGRQILYHPVKPAWNHPGVATRWRNRVLAIARLARAWLVRRLRT